MDRMITIDYERPWLYPKQEAAFFNTARISAIEATTKAGKTVAGIAWLVEQAWRGKPGWNYWWIAPITAQARIAFTRMKRGLPKGSYEANETHKTITLANGTIIWFKGSDDPDSLYGEDVYAAVIDEGSRVKEEAWYAVRTTLTATRGPIRMIGNVKGRRNWFYKICRRAEKIDPATGQPAEAGMEYHKIVALDAVRAGILAGDEVNDARRDLPEAVFKELYEAEPSDDQGNPFGYKAIQACIAPLSTATPVLWGWDLAKSVDWTVGIALDANGNTCRFERFQMPWKETIAAIRSATGFIKAIVDSTGVGDPIVEELQRGGGSNFEGFKFTGPSKQKIMEGLALAIQQSEITYPEGAIPSELSEFEYTYTRTGVRYAAPEGFNDDCVCALALATSAKQSRKGLDVWAKAFGD